MISDHHSINRPIQEARVQPLQNRSIRVDKRSLNSTSTTTIVQDRYQRRRKVDQSPFEDDTNPLRAPVPIRRIPPFNNLRQSPARLTTRTRNDERVDRRSRRISSFSTRRILSVVRKRFSPSSAHHHRRRNYDTGAAPSSRRSQQGGTARMGSEE